jgi:hypothetical protein
VPQALALTAVEKLETILPLPLAIVIAVVPGRRPPRSFVDALGYADSLTAIQRIYRWR